MVSKECRLGQALLTDKIAIESAGLHCAANASWHNSIYFLRIPFFGGMLQPASCPATEARPTEHLRVKICLPRIKMRIKLQRKTELKIAGDNFVSLLFFPASYLITSTFPCWAVFLSWIQVVGAHYCGRSWPAGMLQRELPAGSQQR